MTKNRKGISGIIVSVIMIALVMAAGVIVWTVVRSVVQSGLDEAGSCFNVMGKVSLNDRYTCYNSPGHKIQFSLSLGDIDVDSVVVSISSVAETKTYTITNEENMIYGLEAYGYGNGIILPEKNGGKTYLADWPESPDTIKIAPVINGKQCEASDSTSEIPDCQQLA